MARSLLGSRTMDGASMLRCMVVGMSPEQEEDCRKAIVPVEVVSRRDVREACTSMSTVLPLVVIVRETITEGERAALSEMATACGAEIVTAPDEPASRSFAATLLEALRVAERRRLGMRA